MKEQLKFFDPTQPQTLQIAVLLFYFTAAFDMLFLLLGAGFDPIRLFLVLLGAVAAYGIANEKRIAYLAAIGLAALNLAWFAFTVVAGLTLLLSFNGIIALMFDVALLLLLVHPMSRDYQKIWFR